jgi:hypothetical protein
MNAFQQLKRALSRAPALGLPTQDKFQLHVYEKGRLALGVVTQHHGPTPQPVGYMSKELDQVCPGCLRAVTAVSLLIPEAQKLILGRTLTVYTPLDMRGILNSKEGCGYQTVVSSNTKPSC